mmetsp:Transcript_30545/g.64362  ORF Transcript_30545/g.64362 Transcript_30545/m.64362 type:complete len:216 (-) Transcript_30545:1377-2024(-)
MIPHDKRHGEAELRVFIPVENRRDCILRRRQNPNNPNNVHHCIKTNLWRIVSRTPPSFNARCHDSVLRDRPKPPQCCRPIPHNMLRVGFEKKGDQLPHQLPLHGHTRTGVRCGDGLGLPTRLLCCCTSHTELKADQGTKNNFRTAKQSHHEDLANFLMQWFLVRKVKQTLQNLRRSPPPRIWTSGCHSIQCRRIGGFFCVDLECVHARGDSQQIL